MNNFAFGECHAHLFMNGTDYMQAVIAHRNGPDEKLIRIALEEYQKRGITFIREGGDHYGVSELAAKLAPEYGIELLTPVFAIHKEGHYGKVVGRSFTVPSEFRLLVKEAISRGADFIKIMTSGIMTFQTADGLSEEGLSRETVRGMIETCHDMGMKVMAHTNGPADVIAAAESGVDSIEHGNFQNEESLLALAESKAVWVPTVVTVRNLVGLGRFDDRVLDRICQGQTTNLRYFRKNKGLLALGSDAGAYGVLHCRGLLDEYKAFHEIFPDDEDLDQYLSEGEAVIRTFKRGGF